MALQGKATEGAEVGKQVERLMLELETTKRERTERREEELQRIHEMEEKYQENYKTLEEEVFFLLLLLLHLSFTTCLSRLWG